MAKTKPDWSTLPQDILAMIGQCLNTRIDNLCFRAVCRSFRSSLSLLPKVLSPYLSLKIPVLGGYDYYEYDFDNSLYYLLTEYTVYAFEPLDDIPEAKTWFVRVEELHSGKMRVNYPITGWCNEILSMKLPQSLNLLDYRVKEVTKAHNFAKVDYAGIQELSTVENFEKVTVSSCFDEIDDEFVVMIINNYGSLWFWRNRDKMWKPLKIGFEFSWVHDIVYHDEKFYAVDFDGRALTVDVKSMKITKVAGPVIAPPRIHLYLSHSHRLVISMNDMLLIDHGYESYERRKDFYDLNYPTDLNVYKLDEEKQEWVCVVDDYLEDRLLFAGDYCSFSVSAKEFLGCEGKRVYYQERDVGADIFYLEDEGSQRAFSRDSNMFLPPPNWLKHDE